MKIGLQVPNFTYPDGPAKLGSNCRKLRAQPTRQALPACGSWIISSRSAAGWGPAENEMLEGYSTLAYLAGLRKKSSWARWSPAWFIVIPASWSRTVTTLDVLSGGRAYLGIGAAWNEGEASGSGDSVSAGERAFRAAGGNAPDRQTNVVGRRREVQRQVLSTWRNVEQSAADFKAASSDPDRRHGREEDAAAGGKICRCLQPVRGHGRRRARRKLDILKKHCETVGRDYAEIEKTMLDTVHLAAGQMSSADIIEKCRALAKVGIQHAIFNMPNVYEIKPLETLGREIIPAVAAF